MSYTDLSDLNQTVVCIAYEDDGNTSEERDIGATSSNAFDIPEGPVTRFKAYCVAWNACLQRIQSVVHDIHAPLSRKITRDVLTAYENTLPALPYPEIPTFAVCASDYTFMADIANRLEDPEVALQDAKDAGDQDATLLPARVVHIRPPDCPNITAAMKTLISGFLHGNDGEAAVKRKSATSLAAFDIGLLVAWYTDLKESYTEDETCPQLVVFMHDFEQFDPAVVSDLFHICSLHIPTLSLVFILALVSPAAPSFIHATYRRSTLSLLRLQTDSLPSGADLLERVILGTFFDLTFEPMVMLGHRTLDFIAEFFERHSSSIEGLCSILNIAHLKHFDEPLSLLNNYDKKTLERHMSSPQAIPFLDATLSRLLKSTSIKHSCSTPKTLLSAVSDARTNLYGCFCKLRLGIRLFLHVRALFISRGALNPASPNELHTTFDALSWGLRGFLSEWIYTITERVNSASKEVKEALVLDLLSWIATVPPAYEDDLSELNAILKDGDESYAELGEWLSTFWEATIQDLQEEPLWDVWFMGATPFPSELVNPAPRSSVLTGLLDPYAYVEQDDAHARPRRALWELPDASILFRRYLEAGRMVNVYDWYEAFAMVLETQRRRLRTTETKTNAKGTAKEAASKSWGSMHANGYREEVDGDAGSENEDAEERWKMHVQARFMRALHELDYMGFVKHTGRKADHIIRTVYDGAD